MYFKDGLIILFCANLAGRKEISLVTGKYIEIGCFKNIMLGKKKSITFSVNSCSYRLLEKNRSNSFRFKLV